MRNKIFVYPTDTVWGIGASIDTKSSEQLNALIAEIKQTEKGKPLSVLFTSIEQLKKYINISPLKAIIERNLFEKELSVGIPTIYIYDNSIPSFVYGNSSLLFVRLLPELEMLIDFPITTTSANISGSPPATSLSECTNFIEHAKNICSQRGGELVVYGEDRNLSGNSSTMIFWENGCWNVLRKGRYYETIAQQLEIFST